MQQLIKQRECENFIIATVVIDNYIVGWTVTDRQLQRVTDKTFETSAMAFDFADKNYKDLLR